MPGTAKDVRAGGAFIEWFGKDGLSKMMAYLKTRVLAFNAFLAKAARTAGIAGGALTAPLGALFKGGADRAADLARMSLQMGLPIDVLHKMQYAADAAGVSIDEVMNDWQGRYSGLIARAPAIDPKDAQAAANAQLELSDATRSLQLALLPLVQIVGRYVKLLSEFVKQNAGVAKTALLVGVGLVAVAATIKLVTVAFALLGPAASMAWAAVTGPVGLVAASAFAGLAGGILLVAAATGNLNNLFSDLKSTAKAVGDTLGTTFGGIGDALGKADVAGAWAIALKGMKVLWLEFVDSMTTLWAGFKQYFLGGWEATVAGVKVMWADLTGWMQKAFNSVLDTLMSGAATAARMVKDNKLADAIDGVRGRLAGTGAIDADTFAAKKEAVDEMKTKKDGRAMEIAVARVDLRKEKAELEAMRKKAGEREEIKGPFGDPSAMKQGLLGAITTKGAFSGSALGQQLGASDQVQKQTELMKALVDGKGRAPDVVATKLAAVLEGVFKIR